jgi:hypothetical protein
MLKDDEANKELFDPDVISTVNTTSKQPIFSSFTWTQNIYALDKARVPKEVQDRLLEFKAEKERRDRTKPALPLIANDSRRKDDSSVTGSRMDVVKPKAQLASEGNFSKKRTDLSLVRTHEVVTEDTLGTEDNGRKAMRGGGGMARKPTKQILRTKLSSEDKLRLNFESIDTLIKVHQNEGAVRSYLDEVGKEARNKRLLNPDKYLKDSEALFNLDTILSKATMKRTLDLQARISASYAKLNPSRANHLNPAPDSNATGTRGAVRNKYRIMTLEPKSKVNLSRLKGVLQTQSQLRIPKSQTVPFSLIHTLLD